MLQATQLSFLTLTMLCVIVLALLMADRVKQIPATSQETAAPSAAATQTGAKATPAQDVAPSPLIAQFEILTPAQEQACKKIDPWADGDQIANENTPLSNQACFALRIKAGQNIELHIFVRSADDTVVRLLPNSCNAMGARIQEKIEHDQSIEIPQTAQGKRGALGFGQTPGQEWIYVIASTDTQHQQLVGNALASIQDVCANRSEKISQAELEKQMQQLQEQSGGHIQWLVQTLKHQ